MKCFSQPRILYPAKLLQKERGRELTPEITIGNTVTTQRFEVIRMCSENPNEVFLPHITCVVLDGVCISSQACVRYAKNDKVEGLWNQLEELLTGPLGPNHVCSSCCSLTSQEDPKLPKISG